MNYKLIGYKYIQKFDIPASSFEQSFKTLDDLMDRFIELDYDCNEYYIYENEKIISTSFKRREDNTK